MISVAELVCSGHGKRVMIKSDMFDSIASLQYVTVALASKF